MRHPPRLGRIRCRWYWARRPGLRPSPGGRFAGLDVEESEWGPVLTDFGTRAYCTMLDSDEETYSVMVEGSVDKIELGDLDDPLVYFRGRYRPLD